MENKPPIKKVTSLPTHPDGHTYQFNCCSDPDVWKYRNGDKKCVICGHDWSEEIN